MSNAGQTTRRLKPRAIVLAAALAGLVGATVVTTTAVADRPDPGSQVNPDLQASCGTDVIVILDESGSIDSSNAQGNVASALNAFVTGLQGTNSRMRIVEFSTNARDAQIGGSSAFRDVDASFATDVQTYLTPNLGIPSAGGDLTQDPSSYRPWNTNFFGNQIYTNWEAALFEAAAPGSPTTGNVGAPLVVFLTDGNPNTVGTDGNSTGGNTGAQAASDASIQEMAALQTAGGHVVSMAVGQAVNQPQPFGRLLNLTEPHVPAQVVWNGTGVLNLRTTDAIQVSDFSAIDDALRSVVFALCAPSLTLHKSDQDGGDVAAWDFSTTVQSMSGGTSLDWIEPADPGQTAPSTKTKATDSSGSALFQWTPGSAANPELWSSTAYIEETLLPGWTVDPSTYAPDNQNCTVARLQDDGTISNFTVDLSKTSPPGDPLPGDTVRYDFVNGNGVAGPFALDKADIMTCDVRNQAPSTITIAKSATPLSPPDATPFAFTTASVGALVPLPPSFSLDDDGSDTPLPSSETYTVSPGTFTVTETAQDYWDLTSIECTDQTGQVTATPDLQAGSVEIVMPAGGAITCTFNNIERPQPALNVTKTASPLTFQEQDGSVTYTVTVNNPNGNTNPITITTISDSQQYNSGTAEVVDLSVADPPANGVGDVTANDCNLLIGQTVGTANLTCSFTVAYTGTNAEDDFDDVVTVAGTDKYGFPIQNTGTAHVDVSPAPPQISVDKQNVQPTAVVAPGGPATYSISVTNPVGAIETIELTAVADQLTVDNVPFGAPLDITTVGGAVTATTCGTLVGTFLAPGDPAYTCEFTVDTTIIDPGAFDGLETLTNTVTVTAQDDDPTPQEVEGIDDAQRVVLIQDPLISVFKTDNDARISEPGSNITYDIDIHNLNTATTVTIDVIRDEIWYNGNPVSEGTITIQDDPPGGPIEVVSTLPGLPGAELVSTDCDQLINTVLQPALGFDGQGVPTNPDASASCQITVFLPANAGDVYDDQVVVSGTPEVGVGPVLAENSANTPADGIDPAVTLAKTPDWPADDVTVPETGGEATFTFEITNSSAASTDPITLNTLTDSVFGDLFDPGNPAVTDISCVALQGTVLAQGASTTCQVSAFLSGTVSAPHSNTATITVTDDEGIEAMSSDDGAVGYTNVLPTITVLKTPSPDTVSEYGANVTFSIVVTNTSAEPVTLTSLVDSVYGDLSVLSGSGCALGGTLAPDGGTYSCDFTQFVEQDQSVTPGAATHDNTVTAIAQDDEGFDATAEDPATVTFTTSPPTVEVTKTDEGASVDEPGGTVTYTITVENTSPEPVTITTLTDTITYELPANTIGPIDLYAPTAPVTSSTCTVTELAATDGAPGGPDEMTCSFDVALSGTSQVVSDVVDVIVTDNDGETAPGDAPDNTPINDVPPSVQVVKYANGEDVSTRIVPGEEVTYLFEIFNRSTVEDVRIESVVDDVFGDVTAECGLDSPTWLTPDDGNDASGTDQTTCTILRTPVTDPPGLPEYDHVNTVTVEAADDEIIRSRGGENPLPNVSDDDSVTVEMREPATITVTKTASPPDIPFDFQLNGGDEQTTTPAAGVYPPLTWTDLGEGTYELTETLPVGWELSSITCEAGDPPVDKQFGDITDGASLEIVWGEDVSCVFDNTQLGDVAVDKSLTAGPTQQAGTDLYDVTYQIVVTNESFRDETFDLTDSLGITGDVTVDSIGTITSVPTIDFDATWDGQGNTQLTDGDQPIVGSTTTAGDSTILITIPVTYRVPSTTTTAALTCQPGDPADDGGALNSVTASSATTGQEPVDDQACEDFPQADITWDKTVVDPGATYDATTGEWTIAYDVVVSNNGDGAGEYTLTDELRFGTGVVIGTVTAALEGSTDQTDPAAPGDGVINGAFDGVGDTTVVTGADIVGGATHTWRITVTATIPTATAGAGHCNPDGTTAGGFLNVSDITGATSANGSACAPFSTLELLKIVDSGDGGNADPTDFTLTATGTGNPPAIVQGDGTAIEAVPVDTYQLTETDVPGYGLVSITCNDDPVEPDENGDLFVTVGQSDEVLCVFTNDDAVVDLEITKTDDGVAVYEGGDPFDYTITVTNIGDRDVDTGEPVTVTDTLPAGLSWVSFPAECAQNLQVLTCDLDPADLTAGSSVVITVTVEADAGTAAGTYTNEVYVTTQDDPVCTPIGDCTPPPCDSGSNNVACEDTPVLERSLDVSGFTDVCVGEAPYIRYLIVPIGFSPPPTQATLTIMDIDGNPIDYNGDGVVDDDDKVVVTTMTGNLLWPGAEVDSQGNAVDWPGWKFENGLWTVDPSDAIYREGLLIEVEINPTATAMVSYPPEGSACADPTQVSADLQIVKTTTSTEVLPGQSFTWDLVVTNHGPDEATSLVVTDQVPAPLVLTDVSSADFSCSRSGNSMTCTRPSLAVGAMGTIELTTMVPAGAPPVSNLVNTAEITAVTPDPVPDNNNDSSATSVGCVNCLPATGGDVGGLLRIAAGLLFGGLALVFVNRRRRPAAAADWPAPTPSS